MERSLCQACDRVDFRIIYYSVQSNHAHFIVEAADAVSLVHRRRH
jgi:REP element-mobilizing transposase RayT